MGWLKKPVSSFTFNEAVNTDTGVVINDEIPQEVREILPDFSNLFERIYFKYKFEKKCAKQSLESLDETVHMFEDVKKDYTEFTYKYSEGLLVSCIQFKTALLLSYFHAFAVSSNSI